LRVVRLLIRDSS